MRTIVVATRQSELAMTQTGQVIELLRQRSRQRGLECDFEVKPIITRGDRILDVTLSKVGGKGLFVKEIEQALLDGEADIAVHSMKDMPAQLPEQLIIGAVTKREDPRDGIVSRSGASLADLPQGAVIGTSSLRRMSQLLAFRPDLRIVPLRGNIDSRLKKLESESLDAIVLAAAGLHRIGWADRICEYLPPETSLPCVGQGALGIECHEDNDFALQLLQSIHDEETALAVTAERSFLRRLEGGCQVPIGGYAIVDGETDEHGNRQVRLTGMVAQPDGRSMVKDTMTGHDAAELGLRLAERLLARGADRILAEVAAQV